MKTPLLVIGLFSAITSFAHLSDNITTPHAVLADLNLLKQAHIPILFSDESIEMGYSILTNEMRQRLSTLSHQKGRCGNYEALSEIPQDLRSIQKTFNEISSIQTKNQTYLRLAHRNTSVSINEKITRALADLKSENIGSIVTWLSSYPSRYNRASNPNVHVNDLINKLNTLTSSYPHPIHTELISHRNTPQKSVRVSIKGRTRPNEYIVLGGHLDSINGWGSSSRPAPGADDNASGSASLFEALRVLLAQDQPERTIEFMWYAGEESGLLGSAEIAETYKTEKKNVIAVLQLDMTMFPGDGENKITSMTDFTNPWLRDYLKAINTTYLNIEILEDKCGYGCSDHASWHRRGFPALMPTESKFNSSFSDIHTERDVVSSVMSFQHALIFSKIALVMAMDLGNSNQREPQFQ